MTGDARVVAGTAGTAWRSAKAVDTGRNAGNSAAISTSFLFKLVIGSKISQSGCDDLARHCLPTASRRSKLAACHTPRQKATRARRRFHVAIRRLPVGLRFAPRSSRTVSRVLRTRPQRPKASFQTFPRKLTSGSNTHSISVRVSCRMSASSCIPAVSGCALP